MPRKTPLTPAERAQRTRACTALLEKWNAEKKCDRCGAAGPFRWFARVKLTEVNLGSIAARGEIHQMRFARLFGNPKAWRLLCEACSHPKVLRLTKLMIARERREKLIAEGKWSADPKVRAAQFQAHRNRLLGYRSDFSPERKKFFRRAAYWDEVARKLSIDAPRPNEFEVEDPPQSTEHWFGSLEDE